RGDAMARAGIVEILEQLVARQIAAVAHDPGEPAVGHLDLVALAGLAAEIEAHREAGNLDMTVAQRGQAERAVGLGILAVADPDMRGLEQPHDRGQHLLARQAGPPQIAIDRAPDARQGLGEGDQALELVAVAHRAPGRMVAVLLAAALIAPGRQQMGLRIRADPDLLPGRRHREPADALELLGIADASAGRADILERLAAPPAPDARRIVEQIAQPGRAGIARLRSRSRAMSHSAPRRHKAARATGRAGEKFPRAVPRRRCPPTERFVRELLFDASPRLL